jgi:hypothetical protein
MGGRRPSRENVSEDVVDIALVVLAISLGIILEKSFEGHSELAGSDVLHLHDWLAIYWNLLRTIWCISPFIAPI